MPVLTKPDNIPAPAGSEQPDALAFQDMTAAMQTAVSSARSTGTSARTQADLALNTARDALEVPIVRAQVVGEGIVTASGSTGSIAVDTTVFARPTSGRLANSPTRVVAAKTGTYRVNARAVWSGVSSGALGRRYAQLRKNAAVIVDLSADLIDFIAGEYVELFVQHTQGSGLAVLGGAGGTFISLEYVRPLPQ